MSLRDLFKDMVLDKRGISVLYIGQTQLGPAFCLDNTNQAETPQNPKNMKQFQFLMALIGLIFVSTAQAQPDPSEKKPGMTLQPTYVHAHEGGKPIPAELVIEIQRTGTKSHAPLWALKQATEYRLETVASTFEDKTGNRLDLEQYLGPKETWHEKINNPDNGFLVSNRKNPGRKIWTYGWLPSEFTAPDGTVFPQGWYYFDRNLYMVGEKGYTEPEGTVDLNCEKMFPDIPEMKGVFISWYADGCANPSLPDEIPFKEPVAEQKRQRSPNVVDPFIGSNWVVSVQVSNNACCYQPAPQYFQYCGGVGFGYGWNYCPQYMPVWNNCYGCGSYVNNPPQNITNIYEGDTYITNEGDQIINEGDVVIINNPPADDDGGPVLPPNGDDDGGPILGENGDGDVPDDDGGPILGENGPNLGENGDANGGNDDGNGGNLGNSGGMALQNSSGVMQTGQDEKSSSHLTSSSFAEIDERVNTTAEAEYWQQASSALLAEREQTIVRPSSSSPETRPGFNSGVQHQSQNGGVGNNNRPAVNSRPVQSIEEAQASLSRGNGNGNVNRPSGNQTTSPRPNGSVTRIPSIEEAEVSRVNNNYQQSNNVQRDPNSSYGSSRIPSLEEAQASPSRGNGNTVFATRNPQGASVANNNGASVQRNPAPASNGSVVSRPSGGGTTMPAMRSGGGGGARSAGGGRGR